MLVILKNVSLEISRHILNTENSSLAMKRTLLGKFKVDVSTTLIYLLQAVKLNLVREKHPGSINQP